MNAVTCSRCVVWTGDERVFFYNPSQNVSLWDCPEEIEDRADVKKLIQTPPRLMQQQLAAAAGDSLTTTFGFYVPSIISLQCFEVVVYARKTGLYSCL